MSETSRMQSRLSSTVDKKSASAATAKLVAAEHQHEDTRMFKSYVELLLALARRAVAELRQKPSTKKDDLELATP